jgi:hypothetical protein
MSFERLQNRYSIHALKLVSPTVLLTQSTLFSIFPYTVSTAHRMEEKFAKLHILRHLRLSEGVF